MVIDGKNYQTHNLDQTAEQVQALLNLLTNNSYKTTDYVLMTNGDGGVQFVEKSPQLSSGDNVVTVSPNNTISVQVDELKKKLFGSAADNPEFTVNKTDTIDPSSNASIQYPSVAAVIKYIKNIKDGGSTHRNKVWKTDETGVPDWRDDADTDTKYGIATDKLLGLVRSIPIKNTPVKNRYYYVEVVNEGSDAGAMRVNVPWIEHSCIAEIAIDQMFEEIF